MDNLILFDQDTLHYRQSIYRHFRKVFSEKGYNLLVIYDNKLNTIREDTDFFIGIDYSLKNCIAQIKKYNPPIIIQYIWLKYRFLFPFMVYCRLSGIKTLLWSHGINMQSRTGSWKKYLYYLRQRLSSAQIIYTPNEKKYVVTRPEKVFVANNTLNFHDMPQIEKSREQLKEEYGYSGKKIIICVGRLNTHNRKVELLLQGFRLIEDENTVLIIVGTGVTEEQQEKINQTPRSRYLGPVFDPVKVNEIYKMADLFVMPGGVGLAINHAFYHGLPVLIEDVNHSPEAYYLNPGMNGLIFKKGDATDMSEKIKILLHDAVKYRMFADNARETVASGEASFEKMIEGFVLALEYLHNKRK